MTVTLGGSGVSLVSELRLTVLLAAVVAAAIFSMWGDVGGDGLTLGGRSGGLELGGGLLNMVARILAT